MVDPGSDADAGASANIDLVQGDQTQAQARDTIHFVSLPVSLILTLFLGSTFGKGKVQGSSEASGAQLQKDRSAGHTPTDLGSKPQDHETRGPQHGCERFVGFAGFAIPYLPLLYVLAIERLGGYEAGTLALAYQELHRLTGQQGRLKHVECLQAGE